MTDYDFTADEIVRLVLARKKVVISFTMIFGLLAVFFFVLRDDVYESEALLLGSAAHDDNPAARIAGQFDGLSVIPGLQSGLGRSNRIAEALAILQSRQFLVSFYRSYIKNQSADVDVVQGKYSEQFVLELENPRKFDQSEWTFIQDFRESLRIERSATPELISVSLRWDSAEDAQYLLENLINELNAEMRSHDISEAEKSIEYLSQLLSENRLVAMQDVLSRLIESQTQTLMLADAREQYMFRVIDPPIAPLHTAGIPIILGLALSIIVGALFGIFVAAAFGVVAVRVNQ